MKEERLSPEMPISPIMAAGKAVRHRMMIRVIRLHGSKNMTGAPIATARMPASITFRTLNIPPKNVLEPIKLGGMV